LTIDYMPALVDIPPVKAENDALLLRINEKQEAVILQGGEFAGFNFSNDPKLLNQILRPDDPEVSSAISGAFEGERRTARYHTEINGRSIFCELHCFPNGFKRDINCFVIDRTSEEAEAVRLQGKVYILDIISQAVGAFAETRNLSEILRIVLLGVTAGPGLGFNRGFVLLSNEARTYLWGCLATGPSTAEEAGEIWRELASRSLTLEEILRLYKSSSQNAADIQVNKLVASLKIPLSDESNFIVKAVKMGRSIITGPGISDNEGNQKLIEEFGTNCMAIIPLISRDGLQGVLLADNLITQKPITPSDLKVLGIFARYAADAIENSRLYGRLEQQICRLKEANEKIIQSRENLIKAEKLSSVAKMALDVAHEIRNPLTVIGGYANSCLRKLAPEDPSYKFFEIISRQSSRIEAALDSFSSVVTLSEKREGRFRLVNLVREALGMLSSNTAPDLPLLVADASAANLDVFLDQGLFNQAMMVILRKSSEMTGGMANISVKVARNGEPGVIFIMSSDNYSDFAEKFYRGLRNGTGELKNQEMAVALEILQHYGAGIGIISENKSPMRLYVEFPLCKEDV
jgi:GAF domain-containing protein